MYCESVLTMPKGCIIMDEEEMMYTEGGYSIDWSRSSVAYGIDVAIALASFGMAASASIATVISRYGLSWLKSKATAAILKVGLSTAVAGAAVNLINTVTGFTVGNGLAYVIDKIDKSGLNGRVQF